jgi:hypothetical protein
MGNNHDPERQLSAYPWALLSASSASDSSRLPTVQRGQVLDDRDWQSIDRVGIITARIIWNCNRDTSAPQTKQVNVRKQLVEKKI